MPNTSLARAIPTAAFALMVFAMAGLVGLRIPVGGGWFGYQYSGSVSRLWPDMAVMVPAVAAAAVLTPRLRGNRAIWGWSLGAVGLAMLAVTTSAWFIETLLPHPWVLTLGIFIPVGLALGGLAIVIAGAPPALRWWAAAAFAAGLACADGFASAAGRGPQLVYGLAAAVALGMAVASRSRGSAAHGSTDHSRAWAAALVVTAVAVGTWLLDLLRRERCWSGWGICSAGDKSPAG